MPLEARGLIALQTRLACFKTGFGFRRTLLFQTNLRDLGLLLTEVLHQRNIARADPGAGAALNAVGQVVGRGLVVLLAFAKPVQLLRQQIGRAGIGAGATANAALFLFRFAHFAGRRGQQTVGNFDHRHVEPRQGKAHQRAAHNHHRLSAGAKTGIIQKMAHRRAQPGPDVARARNRFPG